MMLLTFRLEAVGLQSALPVQRPNGPDRDTGDSTYPRIRPCFTTQLLPSLFADNLSAGIASALH